MIVGWILDVAHETELDECRSVVLKDSPGVLSGSELSRSCFDGELDCSLQRGVRFGIDGVPEDVVACNSLRSSDLCESFRIVDELVCSRGEFLGRDLRG